MLEGDMVWLALAVGEAEGVVDTLWVRIRVALEVKLQVRVWVVV